MSDDERQQKIERLISAAESVVAKAEASKHVAVPIDLGWALGTLKRALEDVKR